MRARWRVCHATQAKLLARLPMVAGAPDPRSADDPSLSFNELECHLRQCCQPPPDTIFAGTYDAATDRWIYKEPRKITFLLPHTFELTGSDSIEVESVASLCQLIIKGGEGCNCAPLAVGAPAPKKTNQACLTCSFRPPLRVKRGAGDCSLPEALLCSDNKGAAFEVLSALAYQHPEWPEFVALSRRDPPAGVKLAPNAGHNVVFLSPPTKGLLAGYDFACSMLCAAPGCNGVVYFCGSFAAPQQLTAVFAGAHSHPALPCKMHATAGCADCPACGLLPLPEPYGQLRGMQGVLALMKGRRDLEGHDIGNANSATALRAALFATATLTEQLSGNRARVGANVGNLETVTGKERKRVALRSGVSAPQRPASGEPTDTVGAIFGGLVRCLLAC